MRQYMVEILRISSFFMVFFFSLRLGHLQGLTIHRIVIQYLQVASATPFTRSTYANTPHARKRRFLLKSAYPLYQTEEAVSKFAFETASFIYINVISNQRTLPS